MGKTFLGVHYPPVGGRNGLGAFLDAGAAGAVTFQCGCPATAGQFYATRFQADGNDNPPNFYTDPLQAARDHFAGQQEKWRLNPGAMARLSNNELDIETPWHGQQQVIFYLEFMRLCESVHEFAGICNYAGGNPSGNPPYTFEERWRSVLPAIKYAGEHGHYVVLHIHQQNLGPMESESGQLISLRHRKSIDYWLNNAAHPECIITTPPRIIFNEVSNGVGGVEPDEDGYFKSVTWLDQQCRNDKYNSLYTVLCLYQAGGAEPISETMYNRLAEYVKAQSEIVIYPLPVDPPPDLEIEESYNGATVGSEDLLIDENLSVWWLAAPRNPDAGKKVICDDVQHYGGMAEQLTYWKHAVYCVNAKGNWFKALPAGWEMIAGDPRRVGPQPEPPPVPVEVRLKVPWMGQNTARPDDDYSNSDCGPAAVCMWLNKRGRNVSVDDVSKATGKPAGFTFTMFVDLDRAALVYGLNLRHMFGTVTLANIRAEIDAGRPALLLVNYPSLPKRWSVTYKSSHWILIVGYSDGGFVYHDPYWPDATGGAYLPITNAQLSAALQNVTLNGNTAWQGAYEDTSTPVPVPIATLSGVGVGTLYTLTAQELEAMKIGNVQSVLLLTLPDYDDMRDTVQAVRGKLGSSIDIVGRIFFPEDGAAFTPQAALDYCANGLRGLYDEGVREFQIGNEPNIWPGGLGWNWDDAAEFAEWLGTFLRLLKTVYPLCKWGYPALSPQPNTEAFFSATKAVADRCDFVTVHSYFWAWDSGPYQAVDESGGMAWKCIARQTSKDLYLTEYSCNSAAVSYADKGRMYHDFIARLRQEGRIAKAHSFALSWGLGDANREAWVIGDERNIITDIPAEVGKV